MTWTQDQAGSFLDFCEATGERLHALFHLISEILGHSSTAFTEDVHTVVAEELAEEAARAISAFVPRRDRGSAA